MPRYAAIDIGSNSIRMEVADEIPGSPMTVVATAREVTRLGESVFRTGKISREAMDLTCQVLVKMAEQYKKVDVAGVRAVATSAVRDARNQAEFLDRASQSVGTTVDVISGREEARLIHLGVQSRWRLTSKRVLIIDVGGGSVELIAAENGRMLDAVSKPLGAVRLREVFLGHDPPTELELHCMHDFIAEKLDGVGRRFGSARWDLAVGTSATAAAVARSIARVSQGNGDRVDHFRMSAAQIRKLSKKLSSMDLDARRRVTGIGPKRAEIIIPGVSVLAQILEMLSLGWLRYSAAGVRDGVIADLAVRGVGTQRAQLNPDQRREVEKLSTRYGVPRKHSRQVAALAVSLFHSLQPLHRLPLEAGRLLEAAAFLHDTGHYISDLSHHKHSYYVVANSDMPGFTNREREIVANLCRYHRKALPAGHHPNQKPLSGEEMQLVVRLIPLLRLADGLDRSHEQRIESVECKIQDSTVTVQLLSPGNIDLELWAADRTAEAFRQIYQVAVVFSKKRR